jgi:hypothetical protein
MLEQVLVWVIVVAAAVYAVRAITRGMRSSGDHCGDCGIDEHEHRRRKPPRNDAT